MLTPEAAAKGYPYRKENPLHRLYYHEIAAPDKIAQKMRKLGEWLDSDEFRDLHPITRAARAHFQLLKIYPWTKNSGKVARLLMNFILHAPRLPAGGGPFHRAAALLRGAAVRERHACSNLMIESLENSIETTAKFLNELNGLRVKRAS